MPTSEPVVICGAGIAGVCTAWSLAVQQGVRSVVLVDESTPLSLTSDKSTEAYRNWWPGPDDSMVRFMNRSIDIIEDAAERGNNRILLNRRGYLYATRNFLTAHRLEDDAARAEAQGAGPIRTYRSVGDAGSYRKAAHQGYRDSPDGADLFLDQEAIREHFPFLAGDLVALLHARRCGWFSGQQLGLQLLEEAKAAGVRFIEGRVASIDVGDGHVRGVRVDARGRSETIDTSKFVNCAGPFAKEVAALAGVHLPLFSEMHLKAAFEDTLGVIDRDTGLVILDDEQHLEWTDDERNDLASADETRWLTETMPAGIHFRPEGYRGSRTVLMLWDYHSSHRYDVPRFPLDEDPVYPEVVMRGLVSLVPGLAPYVDRLPHCYVDGGYYTKTEENRPLIGPTSVGGFFVNAAFSGFGLMAAPAAGELIAAHICGRELPSYHRAFELSRYDDPQYRAMLDNWGSTGQL